MQPPKDTCMQPAPELRPFADRYLPLLHTYQDEMLERLATLVNIDSGTGQVEGINTIMRYLREWLEQLGFIVTLHEHSTFGNNLVARRVGQGTARLLLVGHVDTVYSLGAASTHPFTLRDGLAYGPGVID